MKLRNLSIIVLKTMVIFLLLLPIAAGAQTAWAKAYGGTNSDIAHSAGQTSDGGYFLVGRTDSFGAGGYDSWALKLDAAGNVTWQKAYGGASDDWIVSMQQTADGGYIAAGDTRSFGAGGSDLLIIKLDANGGIVWQKTYGGTGDEIMNQNSIQQTLDGGYIVVVRTNSFGAGSYDAWVLKLDAAGNVTWQKTYGGAGVDNAGSIRQTADGDYIVAGTTNSFGAGSYDTWLLKLDSLGVIVWQKTYGGSYEDTASVVEQTSDGGYITCGRTYSFGAGNGDWWVLKLDATGNIAWQKTYGGLNSETAYSVRQASDGGFILAGATTSFGTGGNFLFMKLDFSGNIAWQKIYGGIGNEMGDIVCQTTDGSYIIAGFGDSFGAGSNDMMLVKLDANGEIPGCPAMGISSATIANTSVSGNNTAVTGADTSATAANASVSTADTTAGTLMVCSNCQTITLSPATLPNGTEAVPYAQTITASGGTAPYTYALSHGALPGEFTLCPDTGDISGTPAASGFYSFTITATDSFGCKSIQDYTLLIECSGTTLVFTPLTLPDGQQGLPYPSVAIAASGGTAPYIYIVATGALPAGLYLDPDTGEIAGTFDVPGIYHFTVTATDSLGCIGAQAYTIGTICPTITLTPATLPDGHLGLEYGEPGMGVSLSASGGLEPYIYAVTAGTLPDGLWLDGSGWLYGIPTVEGIYNFTVTATDAGGFCSGSKDYTINVACPTITLTPATLPDGHPGLLYAEEAGVYFSANGGLEPYIYAVTAGALPDGLWLDGSGWLNGIPTVPGIYNFTVTATDYGGICSGSIAYTISTICPTITLTPATLPDGHPGLPYAEETGGVYFSASGGLNPEDYMYEVTAGVLPDGIYFEDWGYISGTPTVPGIYNFTVTATDYGGICSGSKDYTIVVFANGPGWAVLANRNDETISTVDLSTKMVYGPFLAGSLGSSGYLLDVAVTPDNRYALIGNFGSKTVYRANIMNPLAPVMAGSVALSYGVEDIAIAPGGAFALVTDDDPYPSASPISAIDLNTLTIKSTYALTTTGASAQAVAIAPDNQTVVIADNNNDRIIYGIYDPASGFISENALPTGHGPLNVSISPDGQTVLVANHDDFTVSAFRITAPGTLEVGSTAVSLPAIPQSIVFSPDGLKAYILCRETVQLSWLNITGPGVISLGGTDINASGYGGTPYYGVDLMAISVDGATLVYGNPPGQSQVDLVETSSFNVSYVPTSGNYPVGVAAFASSVACPMILLTPSTLPDGVFGTAYSQTITASGGTAPYTYEVTAGDLPDGLILNPATGEITGIPTVPAIFNFTITATDANGCKGSQIYAITINCSIITLSPSILPNGTVGSSYNQTIGASGGTAPYNNFTVSSGSLPPGLGLENSTGALTGIPTSAGPYNFTIAATDSYSCIGIREYFVVINDSGVPPEIATGSSASDNIVFNSSTDISWQGDISAAGYRLYRGIQNGLPSLLNDFDDSCAKYEGVDANATDTADPSLVDGRFYWYIVTAYNAIGEGPAGNATEKQRQINSTGSCQ